MLFIVGILKENPGIEYIISGNTVFLGGSINCFACTGNIQPLQLYLPAHQSKYFIKTSKITPFSVFQTA